MVGVKRSKMMLVVGKSGKAQPTQTKPHAQKRNNPESDETQGSRVFFAAVPMSRVFLPDLEGSKQFWWACAALYV
jgi:hypothetical protein